MKDIPSAPLAGQLPVNFYQMIQFFEHFTCFKISSLQMFYIFFHQHDGPSVEYMVSTCAHTCSRQTGQWSLQVKNVPTFRTRSLKFKKINAGNAQARSHLWEEKQSYDKIEDPLSENRKRKKRWGGIKKGRNNLGMLSLQYVLEQN